MEVCGSGLFGLRAFDNKGSKVGLLIGILIVPIGNDP
jgi:hypothetical protein